MHSQYFIGGTGTDIYKYNSENDKYEKDLDWQKHILTCWDFDLISSLFDELPGFNRRLEDERTEKFNLNYWCKAVDLEANRQAIEDISKKLEE